MTSTIGHRRAAAAFTFTSAIAFASAIVVSACGSNRSGFHDQDSFATDRDAEAAPPCPLQCSLDGRQTIRTCTGEVVETCAPNLACGAGVCQEPCAAAAADRSSNGCEFYFQTPRFSKTFAQSCYAAFLVNTSNQPADVSLELEGKALDISKAVFRTDPGSAELLAHTGPVLPGESVIVFVSDRDPNGVYSEQDNRDYTPCPAEVVPASTYDIAAFGTGIGSSFHLKTSVPVATSTIYPFGGAKSFVPSATLLLPVATWANEHILVNPWEVGRNGSPGAQIVASEDDTEVTILPTTDILDGEGVRGTAAKVPVTYKLAKGQFLQLVQRQELSGSIVSSTKPTTIFGGHGCADIPTSGGACDILGQQIPAFQQWGSEYATVGYRPRLGNEHEPVPYRIVAAMDGTRLEYDPAIPPGAPTTLSAGEVAMFRAGAGDAFVVHSQDADHPFYLAAYMLGADGDGFTNSNFGGRGDPEFVNVVPAGQYLSSYSFYADPTYAETSLVVIRAKTNGAFKDVWLECAGNLTGFRPLGTRGEYEWMRIDLTRNGGPGDTFGGTACQSGLQRMRSEGPFTATLWGWDIYASYAYPGGLAQRKLVEQTLPPIR